MTILSIPLSHINANPWQTRSALPEPEYIKELALDIVANGLLQTPIGRFAGEVGDGELEGTPVQLAFGHNRLVAYKWLYDLRDNSDIKGDWSKMPVDVRELTDIQMADLSWAENDKRQDFTPLERAQAINKRMEDFNWSQKDIAEHLRISAPVVSNSLRLLKLPEDLQKALLEGKISERQGLAILPIFEAPDIHGGQGNSYTVQYYTNPSAIVAAALEGESSDALRNRVERYFTTASIDMSQAEFKLDQLFPEGEAIYCGLCKTCDRRMASRNRCFDSECFHAKTAFVRREYLKKASKESGYGILDEQKGGYPSNLPYEEEKFERILATKCPNLVLAWSIEKGTHCVIEKFPHAVLVCEKRNDSCTCVRGLNKISSLGSAQSKLQPLIAVFAEEGETSEEDDYHEEGDNDDYTADDAQAEAKDLTVASQAEREQEGIFKMPAPLTAQELEDAARQARQEKKAIVDQMPVVRAQLEEHLYQALAVEEATGVLFVVAHNSVWPYGSDLDRNQLYHYMAKRAAQTIMPSSAESLGELLKAINHHLDNLKLEQLVIEETEAA